MAQKMVDRALHEMRHRQGGLVAALKLHGLPTMRPHLRRPEMKKYILVCFGCFSYFTGTVDQLYCSHCDAQRGK
jgi:hypothetical protein